MTRGTRTTQSNTTGAPQLEPAQPGLVAVFVQSSPTSIVIPLVAGEAVIGRSLLATLGVDDARMSREHVHVSTGIAGWQLRDLDSRNGTYVDGVRVSGTQLSAAPRVLRAGDTLLLPVADVKPFMTRPVEVFDGVVIGPVLHRVLDKITRTAASRGVLHIHGETGVGKELAARRFHDNSGRKRGPFVAVNCAAIPAPLAERLLFGVRRGTYTGADADADGLIQSAEGGTVFLDEIADLDLAVQGKLLRTLESGEVLPLGGAKARRVDCAFVSATAAELEARVADKSFRQDLYFRVARPTVELPPLRDRIEEIPWLAAEAAKSAAVSRLHASFVEAALCRAWPGNVRELLLETRAAAELANEQGAATIRASHLAEGAGALLDETPATRPSDANDEDSRQCAEIVDALRCERGNVAAAARRLGLHRTQLRRLIARHKIDPRAGSH